MTPSPDQDAPRPDPAAQPSLAPFLAALAVVGVVGVLAFVFLRSDDEGELVRPDRLDRTGEHEVRALVTALPECQRLSRAQADLGEERILVELVAVDVDGCTGDGVREVVAEIRLPQPVGDRAVVAGVGRVRMPCVGDGSTVRCEAQR